MENLVQFNLNGSPVSVTTDDDRMFLWILRTDLALTGTKYGCGEGICGACAMVINGEAHRSCRTGLKQLVDAEVVIIEGLAKAGVLHALQQAFIDHGAFQCGYCTSGMLLDAYVLLQDNPHPTRAQIVARMDHNLCRCGAHQRIVAAIEQGLRPGSDKVMIATEPLCRRDVHKLAGGGMVILFGLGRSAAFAQPVRPSYPEDFHAYLAIHDTGWVTIFSCKIEMGQCIQTSLAQMARHPKLTFVPRPMQHRPSSAGWWIT